MNKAKLGQGMIEYVIVFAVVVGALIAVAWGFKGKVLGAVGHLSGEMSKVVK